MTVRELRLLALCVVLAAASRLEAESLWIHVRALLLDPGAGSIYAAAWKKGIFASKDGGKSWTLVGGSPPHPDVIALALDRSGPGRVLVGTGGGSVWRLDTTAAPPPAAEPKPTPAPVKKKKT
jgi:hypothetical protein